MNNSLLKHGLLTGNMLKIIALIAMTIDHIGAHLLPQYNILRIIGRLAFPIFAYMIAEGCKYTKSRQRYLSNMIYLAFICQATSFIAARSLNMCIIVTFSLSIACIYTIDYIIKKRDTKSFVSGIALLFAVYFVSEMLPKALIGTDYNIDYGFFGILTPVFIYLGKTKMEKISMAAFGLVLVATSLGGIQWYALLSIPLLIMYNGKRGQTKLKNLFYIYYPVHIAVIYLIGLIVH